MAKNGQIANQVIRDTHEGAINLDTSMQDLHVVYQPNSSSGVQSNANLIPAPQSFEINSAGDNTGKNAAKLINVPSSSGMIRIQTRTNPANNLRLNFTSGGALGTHSRVSLNKAEADKLNEHYEHMILTQK